MNGFLKLLLWTVGILTLVVGGLYFTVIDFWAVPSDDPSILASIAPTLAGGDMLVIGKESTPDVPNLVRCVDPDSPEAFVIGRVIARNSEPITIVRDVADSRRRRQPSPRRCKEPVVEVMTKEGHKRLLDCWEENYADSSFQVLRSVELPSPDFSGVADVGKLFLVSDNRPVHVDSRDFGAIDPSKCRRIYMRLWGAGGITEPKFEWVF